MECHASPTSKPPTELYDELSTVYVCCPLIVELESVARAFKGREDVRAAPITSFNI
jgi:hypothetical protein